MDQGTLEALILSGAAGIAVGTFLYYRRPAMVTKTTRPPRNPSEEVAARLRAVVPDELIESIEVDLQDPANPIALELSRDATPDEKRKINQACTRALADLLELPQPAPRVVPADEPAAEPTTEPVGQPAEPS